MRNLRLSVGITAYNEEANIGKALESLLSQGLPRWLKLEEVVVVASGCTDRTEDVVRSFEEQDERVKLVVEPERRGQTSAINLLIDLLEGDVVVFMCADTLPSKGALGELAKPLRSRPDVGAVIGRAVPLNEADTFWGFLAHLQYKWMYRPELLAVNFESMSAIRRELLKPVPETVMVPELYLDALVKGQGYRVVQAPKAVVYTMAPTNIRDYMKQKTRDTFHIMHLTRYMKVRVKRRGVEGVLALLADGVREAGIRRAWWLACALGLWTTCYLKAILDMMLGREARYRVWEMVESSKVIWKAADKISSTAPSPS
ncbi:hypothetical protein DRO60_05635 [Candidatus Bathyarchaeota archaeon]|nr:MAG: hypothetical protein DRO60_05635 [Candidatus Bathyarchaeota archaeon]